MLFPKFSPDEDVDISKSDLRKVLKKHKCYLARFISEFDNPEFSKFWYVIKDQFIPIEKFSKNTRNQVKKGLKNCEVKKVSQEYYRENCYDIYEASMHSYELTPITRERFEKVQREVEKREYWVVLETETNTPIAYSNNLINNGTCNYAFIKYHPDYLSLYPSYALHYEMDKHYLVDEKMKFVNMGAKTLYHETSVQDFVIQKFKYRKAYCKLNIVYKPLIGLIVKLAFPFRKLIYSLKINKVSALLKQHEAAN
ncbi:MAG: hypothetical protein ABF294_01985 [Flavobacteriales bacterium]|jgi:hypothetical protein